MLSVQLRLSAVHSTKAANRPKATQARRLFLPRGSAPTATPPRTIHQAAMPTGSWTSGS
jgi:hypothetical protein